MSTSRHARSRRRFLQASLALTGLPLIGASLVACGGGSDDDDTSVESRLASLTASQVVAQIANGSLGAERYMRAMLGRASSLAHLNAFIALNTDRAIAAAQAVDARRAAGLPLGALAGLPIAVKDNINTVDLPTTGGTPALRNVRAPSNAPVLQRLIDAGAIVIGKANMHELAFGTTSTNFASFAGPVKNPYDTTRVPGGSSGGTGAAIGARMVPAGLGTDTGGSVRIPAALCGIAGLRPTVGTGGTDRRYDGAGVLPISHTRDTVGPMGRTVADIALLDAVIAGQPQPTAAPLGGLRVGVPASFWSGADNEVVAVLTAARTKLANAGVTFVDVDMADIWALDAQVSFTVVLHEANQDIPDYLAATGVQDVTIASIAAGIASPDVRAAFAGVIEDANASAYDHAVQVLRPQMQAVYAAYFADHQLDAMCFPTTIVQAPVIDLVRGSGTVSINGGAPVDTFQTMIRNADPGSTTGVPGISLPGGRTAAGLPVGLSLDGPMHSDRRLLAIGMAMEAVLGLLPAPAL